MSDETKAATFEVRRWQTYVPCRPPSYAYPGKPFVIECVVGDRAEVWDPTGGQRMGGHRWVALRNLHATNKTQTGRERLTGWYLHCEPPTDPVKQELCGSCFRWLDRDQFGVLAWGFGHSTCKPCKAEIEERYGKITS